MFSSNNSQVSNDVKYIEEYFSTFLYSGTGSSQTINNGIDLATKGGLTWIKDRGAASTPHMFFDTARGVGKYIQSNSTGAQGNIADTLTAFNSNGFTVGADSFGVVNASGHTYTSWSWAKTSKFFDVVTVSHTNGVADTVDLSGLGTVGCVIVKCTSASDDWYVWHRGCSAGNIIRLNLTDAQYSSTKLSVSGTTLTISSVFATGTYVVYAYAHNAGGFGLTGTDNVISCGSYTGTGATPGPVVTLGYEPQFIIWKRATGGTESWHIRDNMRGMPVTASGKDLYADLSSAEGSTTNEGAIPTATGFQIIGTNTNANASGATYIYIAIRRGPMKVPTSGTSVFSPNAWAGTGSPTIVPAGFPIDMVWIRNRSASGGIGGDGYDFDRLRGNANALVLNSTAAEDTSWGVGYDYLDNSTGFGVAAGAFFNNSGTNYIDWMFRRAPSFFDEVCYTGTGSARTVTHNLGVAPELMLVKRRDAGASWVVYSSGIAVTDILTLQSSNAAGANTAVFNSTAPTSSVFTVGTSTTSNGSGGTYVAYLFATCAGVSKCTAFTGNGTSQTINCGFTSGARFVMIKATSTTGNWTIFDSARGISAGGDPALYLNSTAAEVTGVDAIDADSTGFIVNQESTFNLNASGVQYLVLAIA